MKEIFEFKEAYVTDKKSELDGKLVVIYADMKTALKRAEQGIKSKIQNTKIDGSTTEVQRLSSEVKRLLRLVPKRNVRMAKRRPNSRRRR